VSDQIAIAIAAHPDDIEFTMAGTLFLLRQAGYQTHYLNISSGSCGSLELPPDEVRKVRRNEGKNAAKVLGAKYHESRVDDFEILYTLPLLRWLSGVIREVRPSIILTHPPNDYMEDHENTCRLVVSATFTRGMPNFEVPQKVPIWSGDTTIYHSMPFGLQDKLRRKITPGAFVNTASVHEQKLAALKCHTSQQGWLQSTQGMNSYLSTMESMSREVGLLSQQFDLAEGWSQHSHMGFCKKTADPLRDLLNENYLTI